jgi:hypothetical protein
MGAPAKVVALPDAASILRDNAVREIGVPISSSRSFSFLRRQYDIAWSADGNGAANARILLDMEHLTTLLRNLATRIPVDDVWHRARYPDVEDGIHRGEFKSATHHYVGFGYFEDRLPQYIEVDDHFYRSTYPDVVDDLKAGRLASSQEHFEMWGFQEGRLPWSEWRLVD